MGVNKPQVKNDIKSDMQNVLIVVIPTLVKQASKQVIVFAK